MHCILYGFGGVGTARYAHGLEHIRSARKGIADGAAEAGSRTAEGFDFGGVIVSFVFEHDGVLCRLTVKSYVYVDGAGVYLVRFVEIGNEPVLFELFGRNCGDVHKAGVLIRSACIHLLEEVAVELESLVYPGVVRAYLNVLDARCKGSVTAVV